MSTEPIHLFVPHFRTEEVLAEIRPCLERGWTGVGYKTLEFEAAWCDYTGLPHAHFLNSATAGLHLAIHLLKEEGGWREGDEIVTTPFTFVSSNHAILYERLQPIFADIDDYLCLDPHSVAERIGPRTRAVLFVGIGGNPGQLDAIAALCRERGLKLILDAAHMAGTWLGGEGGPRHAGAQADVSVFSFHAVKNLPTADAGMICLAAGALDRQARKLSWLGISKDTYARSTDEDLRYRWQYDVEQLGFKYHGNSIMAAMALVGLRYLDDDNACRRRLAEIYDVALECVNAKPVPMAPRSIPSHHLYQVLVENRDEVMEALNAREIYPGVHYQENSIYPMYEQAQLTCPAARRASDRVISLPMHLGLSEKDVVRVAAALEEIVGKNNR